MKRRGLIVGVLLVWASAAPLSAVVQCGNQCERKLPPVPEPARPPGPRTIVVTEQGRPRLQIGLARPSSAGPAVSLGVAYAPGAAAEWTGAGGAPLIGSGWTLTFPCLAAADEEDPPRVVVFIHEGIERCEFARLPDGCSYASARMPSLRLRRDDEDRFELRDLWGDAVICAGFTSRWPAPQRGKPLAYANPYFDGERAAAFRWSEEGLLDQIVDASGRVWEFAYADDLLREVLVARRDGLPLASAEFLYGPRVAEDPAAEDGLVAVTHTLPGGTAHRAAHVFRYHAEGVQAGLLAYVLEPDAVVELGGPAAALRAGEAEVAARAGAAFAYARSGSPSEVVVSAFRGPACSACATAGWYEFEYVRNPAPADAADWAVQVIQRNPEGSTTLADFNGRGQLLNLVRAASDADGVAHEVETYRYDAAGRLAMIVYPAGALGYDGRLHQSVPVEGRSEGTVRAFAYDAAGRLVGESLGATRMLFTPVKDGWVTLRTYAYEGDAPWPAVTREYPLPGQGPAAVSASHEFLGPAAGLRLVRRVERLPAVPESQNGSGLPAVREQRFDPDTGALVKEIDANGRAVEYAYDDETGVLVRETTPSGVTRWFVDPWGQIEAKEHPDGVREITYRAWLPPGRIASLTYREAGPEARGPVAIVVQDLGGRVLSSAVGSPAPGLRPEEALIEGAGDLADLWRGELADHDDRVYSAGRLQELIARSGDSIAVTRYAYDAAGRLAAVVTPDETAVLYTYDAMSRLLRVYEGRVNGATAFTLRERRAYDAAGRLAAVRAFSEDPGAAEGTAGAVTEFVYDWRGRRVEQRDPDGEGLTCAARRFVYDNLDRVIELHARPRGATGFSLVRTWDYDVRGRVWREAEVNVENPRLRQTTRYWHDAEQGRCKTLGPGGGFTKELRDEAGRIAAVYAGVDPRDGAEGEPYAEAVGAAGLLDDTILEEEHYAYDAGGRETLVTHRMRPAAGRAPPVPPALQTAVWYDPLGRVAHIAVQGGDAWRVRPAGVPAAGAGVLRTDLSYDSFGRLRGTRYPDGRVLCREYDARSRAIAEIEAGPGGGEPRVRTEYTYDGADRVVRERVDFGDGEPPRETAYEYGVRLTGAFPSALASGRLLAEIRYPDPATGMAGSRPEDRERFAYDAQGRIVRRLSPADPDGGAVLHEYTYDGMGRLLVDSVAAVASSTDTGIRCVARAYDGWGRLARVTAHGDARPGGAVRNEVAWEYNGFGQITSVRQAHDGACDAASPAVRCVWSEAAGGDGLSRLRRLVHPEAEGEEMALDYRYEGEGAEAADRAFGRARGISAAFLGGRSVASYAYQGLATPVARDTAAAWPGFALRRECAFDDFGRVRSAATALAWEGRPLLAIGGTRYAYDDGGRVTEESDTGLARRAGGDRLRGYDERGRLVLWAEGDRAQGVLGNVRATERWRLSGSGNWEEHARDGVAEERVHDLRDALDALGGIPCAHDGEGNVTRAAGMRCTYDAWNRLTAFEAGGVEGRIARDGLGRPVRETIVAGGAVERTRDLYYRHPWQLATMIERAGAVETREDYVWGLEHEDELILAYRRTGARREVFHYVQDALWNVTAVLNEIGLPIERYTYSPYGVARIWDGAFRRERAASAVGAAAQFQGRRLHGPPALGVYDFRYRAYRPRLGRFLQRDPARIPYGHNLYAAPFGASFLDPYGLKPRLRNCWTADHPILEASLGAGLVIQGEFLVRSTVCECCNRQDQWVKKGWIESGVTAGLSVGLGIAQHFTVAGHKFGVHFELANVKMLQCTGSVIADRCTPMVSPCVTCSRSAGFGVPVLALDLGFAAVSGGAQFAIEAEITICYADQRVQITASLCYGWEASVEMRIFWLRRVFALAGQKTCVRRVF